MVAYADTSFLVSLYLAEETSERAVALASRLTEPLPMNLLLLLEFRNALNLRVKRAMLDIRKRESVWRTFEADIAAGNFVHLSFSMQEIYRDARSLSDRLSPRLGTRSLDLLHVASAVTLGVKELYTFDERQAKAAESVGLKVRPR